MDIALLYAYNGAEFNGSVRTNDRSVESILIAAFTKLLPLSLQSVSRSASTEVGEHAHKQVLSFTLVLPEGEITVPEVPSVDSINALLPETVRLFKVISLGRFSARKDCEARTWEYLIPSYIFTQPSEATMYCFGPQEDHTMPTHSTDAVGGLFNTKK